MANFLLPPDVRDWLEREACFRGVTFEAVVVDYLTEAVLEKKKLAAKVVPLKNHGG